MMKLYITSLNVIIFLPFCFMYAQNHYDQVTKFIENIARGKEQEVPHFLISNPDLISLEVPFVRWENKEEIKIWLTPLIAASSAGLQEVVEKLLALGADPSKANKDGETPLMAAVAGGHTATVVLLLQKGAEVNAQDNLGLTALMYAALNNNKEMISLLINHGADQTLKNKEDKAFNQIAGLRTNPRYSFMVEKLENLLKNSNPLRPVGPSTKDTSISELLNDLKRDLMVLKKVLGHEPIY